MNPLLILGGAILVLVVLSTAIKTIWQYETGLVFRFGKMRNVRKPELAKTASSVFDS